MKILMVCLGNICRSPIAEGVLQHLAQQHQLNWQVHSAGTSNQHEGEAPHSYSQWICKQHGIDISQQQSRPLQASDFDTYDLIFVMDNSNYKQAKQIAGSRWNERKVKLLLSVLPHNSVHEVPDPWYGGKSGYVEVYNMIEAACNTIIQQYK